MTHIIMNGSVISTRMGITRGDPRRDRARMRLFDTYLPSHRKKRVELEFAICDGRDEIDEYVIEGSSGQELPLSYLLSPNPNASRM